jgi:hypothetical protein
MGTVKQILQTSNCYSIDLYQPYNINIIEYYSTYYGTYNDGLKCMFANPTYLQLDDGASSNESCNQNLVDEVGIVNIRGLTTMDKDSCFDNVNVPKGPSTPIDRALAHLHETMAEIMTKCTACVSIELCDHATSLLQGIASNIHHLHLAQVNDTHAPRNGISSGGLLTYCPNHAKMYTTPICSYHKLKCLKHEPKCLYHT